MRKAGLIGAVLIGWFFISIGQVGEDGSRGSIAHPQIATSGVFAERVDCESVRQLLATLGVFTVGCFPSAAATNEP